MATPVSRMLKCFGIGAVSRTDEEMVDVKDLEPPKQPHLKYNSWACQGDCITAEVCLGGSFKHNSSAVLQSSSASNCQVGNDDEVVPGRESISSAEKIPSVDHTPDVHEGCHASVHLLPLKMPSNPDFSDHFTSAKASLHSGLQKRMASTTDRSVPVTAGCTLTSPPGYAAIRKMVFSTEQSARSPLHKATTKSEQTARNPLRKMVTASDLSCGTFEDGRLISPGAQKPVRRMFTASDLSLQSTNNGVLPASMTPTPPRRMTTTPMLSPRNNSEQTASGLWRVVALAERSQQTTEDNAAKTPQARRPVRRIATVSDLLQHNTPDPSRCATEDVVPKPVRARRPVRRMATMGDLSEGYAMEGSSLAPHGGYKRPARKVNTAGDLGDGCSGMSCVQQAMHACLVSPAFPFEGERAMRATHRWRTVALSNHPETEK